MADAFEVEVQGLAEDRVTANGSYDAVSLGDLGAEELAALLEGVVWTAAPGDELGDDLCWPNVIVNGPRGLHTFSLQEGTGRLYCAEIEDDVTVAEAMALVTGAAWSAPGSGGAAGFCSGCGGALAAGDAFCSGCGAKVAAGCAGCGASLKPEDRFCPDCGRARAS